MANLAIRGHRERGKEVIKILEMLGGKNSTNLNGTDTINAYYIRSEGYIDTFYAPSNKHYTVFTLEEFLEKYPYKVGDKVIVKERDKIVTITDMDWRNGREVIYETLFKNDCYECFSVDELQPYKEQESMEEQKLIPPYMDYDVRTHKMNPAEMDGERFIVPIPKGYEFAGIDDDNQQVVFEKIKPQYPKTYGECCRVLELTNLELPTASGYGAIEIEALQQLLICRNAYWKLAGDWKPDWNNLQQLKYSIWFDCNGVCLKSNRYSYAIQHILTFPTQEIRDAFYENFKNLIEECKELL